MALTRPSFVLGADSALVLKCGTLNQSIIKGFNKLGLPSLMRNVISITEFRTDFDIEFTTSGKIGQISFGGNLLFGDSKGQDQLKQYLIANAKFSDARLYLDYNNFLACDLARDPASCWQVAEFSAPETDKNGVYSVSGKMVCGGLFAYFVKHLTGTTIAFAATGNKITDSANGFLTAGFEVGHSLIVEGSTGNSGHHLITGVTAGEITCDATVKTIVTEAVGPSVTLHGGRL